MKYTLLWNINDDTLKDLMIFMNSTEWDVTIFIDSDWWPLESMYAMLDIINYNSDRVTLLWWCLGSAAFLLFLYARCKKRLVDSAFAIVHKVRREMKYSWRGPWHEDWYKVDWIDNCQPDMAWILIDDELVKYQNGGDVYLSTDRLREIFGIE